MDNGTTIPYGAYSKYHDEWARSYLVGLSCKEIAGTYA